MKIIQVSEAAMIAIRDKLIADLTGSMNKREEQIKSGNVTGMTVSPGGPVAYHVSVAFDALREA